MEPPDPPADRPFMPGYGVLGPTEGTGLLSWRWADNRLVAAHDYWLASSRPDGRPHLMPVWGVWDGAALFFSSANGSRKARNLRASPRCSVATDDAYRPVVLEGDALVVTDPARRKNALDLENAKYGTDYGIEMLNPDHNTWFEFRPVWAFALDEDDFTGSPTRWSFVGDADA